MNLQHLLAVTSLLLLVVHQGGCFPSGAPVDACETLSPDPVQHGAPPNSSEIPYFIDLSFFTMEEGNLGYIPGNTYPISLKSDCNQLFRGFLIQGRQRADDSTVLGTFVNINPTTTRFSSCNSPEQAVTHFSSVDKDSEIFTWVAPPAGSGGVWFGFAVVQIKANYWVNQRTAVIAEILPEVKIERETYSLIEGGRTEVCVIITNGFVSFNFHVYLHFTFLFGIGLSCVHIFTDNDEIFRGNHTVSLSLEVPSNITNLVTLGRNTSSLVIVDDDVPSVMCPSLDNPENGMVSVSGLTVGSVANYSCSDFYQIVGNPTQACENQDGIGTWNGDPPSCELTPQLPVEVEFESETYTVVEGNSTEVCVRIRTGIVFIEFHVYLHYHFFFVNAWYNVHFSIGLSVGSISCITISIDDDDIFRGDQIVTLVLEVPDNATNLVTLGRNISNLIVIENDEIPMVMCSSLDNPDNGLVSVSELTVGSVANYSCNDFYQIVANPARVCENQGGIGTWSGDPPTCELTPQLPVELELESETYTVVEGNSTEVCVRIRTGVVFIEFHVYLHYHLIFLSAWYKVHFSIGLSFGSISCVSIFIDDDDTFRGDQTVTLVLEVPENATNLITLGRNTSNLIVIENDVMPSVMCSSLDNPDNGLVSVSGLTVGSVANYSCNDFYQIVGNPTRVCDGIGIWSGDPPSCELTPQLPVEVEFESESYMVVEGNSTEVCVRIRTGVVFIEFHVYLHYHFFLVNAWYNVHFSIGLRVGSISCITISIEDDDIFRGDQIVTLVLEAPDNATNLVTLGRNTSNLVVIENDEVPMVMCSSLNNPDNGVVSVSGLTVGSVANYSCNDFYRIVGNPTQVCENQDGIGIWSGDPPTCELTPQLPVEVEFASESYTVVEGNSTEVCVRIRTGVVFIEFHVYLHYHFFFVNAWYNVHFSIGLRVGSISCITISIEDDDIFRGDQIVTLVLEVPDNATNLVTLGRNTSNLVVIENDEVPMVMCPSLDNPDNGLVSVSELTVGFIANYSCNDFYLIVGNPTRVCENQDGIGTWSGDPPLCELTPQLPVEVEFASETYTVVEGNSTEVCVRIRTGVVFIKFHVYLHYHFFFVNAWYNVHFSIGLRVGSISCITISIEDNDIFRGDQIVTLVLEVPDNATNLVTLGRNTSNLVVIENDEIPMIMCPSLDNPDNGLVSVSGLTVGSIASYSCNDFYQIVGNPTRVCENQDGIGTWNGDPPTCELTPQLPVEVEFESETYMVVEGNSTEVCVRIRTGVVFIEFHVYLHYHFFFVNAWYNVHFSIGLRVGSISCITISIEDDDLFRGDQIVTLVLEVPDNATNLVTLGRNTSNLVVIENDEVPMVTCPSLNNPENGLVSVSGLTVGSVANYSCNDFYQIVENPTRVCENQDGIGTWSGDPPTCELTPQLPVEVEFESETYTVVEGNSTEVCVRIRTGVVFIEFHVYLHYHFFFVNAWYNVHFSIGLRVGSISCITISIEDDDLFRGDQIVTLVLEVPDNATNLVTLGRNTSNLVVIENDEMPMVMCPSLDNPDNGLVSVGGLTVGSTANYSCNDFYQIVGNLTRVCENHDGIVTWSGDPPSCELAPQLPVEVEFESESYTVVEGNSTEVCVRIRTGVVFIEFHVYLHYHFFFVNAWYNVHFSIGLRVGSISCITISIEDDDIFRGDQIVTLVLEVPDNATNLVTLGRNTSNLVVIENDEVPMVMCPSLNNPSNGLVSVSGLTIGSVANYSCNDFYQIVGNPTRVCENQDEIGTWSGDPPICELTSQLSVEVGLEQESYSLAEGNSTEVCVIISAGFVDGEFYVYLHFTTCLESLWFEVHFSLGYGPGNTSCVDILIDDNNVFIENQTVTLVVEVPDDMSNLITLGRNTSILTVIDNDVVLCLPLDNPENGTVVLGGLTVGSIATYSCNNLYKIVGNFTRVCQNQGEAGVWSGDDPICELTPQLPVEVGLEQQTYTLVEGSSTEVCTIINSGYVSIEFHIYLHFTFCLGSLWFKTHYSIGYRPGNTSCVDILIDDDDIFTGNQTVTLFLEVPAYASNLVTLGRNTSKLVIIENDAKPMVFALRHDSFSLQGSPSKVNDNDSPPLEIQFDDNTPEVIGSEVRVLFTSTLPLSSAICEITGQKKNKSENCIVNGNSGFFTFDGIKRVRPHRITITATSTDGKKANLSRIVRSEATGQCSAHLINKGITINTTTGMMEFQISIIGPSPDKRVTKASCQLDNGVEHPCPNPLQYPADAGDHSLIIRPIIDPDVLCSRRQSLIVSYTN